MEIRAEENLGNPIDIRQVAVSTTTVDVKIMRLDGKQMTLSVFRQIPEESIFQEWDEDGKFPSLKGTAWGRVCYTWKDTPAWATYYLVWQLGDQLRKMPMCKVANLESRYPQETYRCYRRGKPLKELEFVDNGLAFCGYITKDPGYQVWKNREIDIGPDEEAEACPEHGEDCLDLDCDYFRDPRGDYDRACAAAFQCLVAQLEEFETLDQLFIAL